MATLQQGTQGEEVKRLQLLLNSSLVPPPDLTEDGDFGRRTHDAVLLFQKLHGLQENGIVDTGTWAAIGAQAVRALPSGAPAWLTTAAEEMGVREIAAPGKENPRIVEYHAVTSLRATTDEVPWCSSFVNWVMKKHGIKGTGSAAAASWLQWGKEVPGQLGAITVIKKKGASSDAATGSATGFHVGFFISQEPTHIRLFGGNQGDQVKYSNFLLSGYDLKGIRWPV